jgi:two-component system NtrC family sensor kinase
VKDTLTRGHSTVRHDRTRGRDDQTTEWEISTYPIYSPTNEPFQAILVETDITERRRLEVALIQSEKLAALGQLAAGVAHEINNPLAAIIANAQMAAHDLDPETDLFDAIKLIQMAGERASDVVNNLLRLSRKEDYDLMPLDLNDTIRNAILLMQHAVAARLVDLRTDMEEGLPEIYGSVNHLQGVWINLIQNALDAFDEPGGVISISTHRQPGALEVKIADNGKGIETDDLSRIFEPFYTTKSIGRGTGLGLSLCHQIVKQHRGTIGVESRIGMGTEFVVNLPLDSTEPL